MPRKMEEAQTVIFVLMLVLPVTMTTRCPIECSCDTKNTITCSLAGRNTTEIYSVVNTISHTTASLTLKNSQLIILNSSSLVGNYTATLKVLKIQGCEIGEIGARTFAHFARLRYLYFVENSISVFHADALHGISNLGRLVLNNNNFHYLVPDMFRELNQVVWLEICGNKHLQGLPGDVFASLTLLVRLKLVNNGFTEIKDPSVWNGLTNLQYLYLNDNQISFIEDGVFSNLKSLRGLTLPGNRLLGLSSEVFMGLHSLNLLYLHNNPLQHVPSASLQLLPQLKNLNLANTTRSDFTFMPKSFTALSQLQRLTLSSNNLHQIPTAAISEMHRLKILDLSRNSISHLPEYAFANLTNLTNVKLLHNRIMSVNPAALYNLPHLNSLSLFDNRIRHLPGQVFSEFFAGNKTGAINLKLNQLSCDCLLAEFIQWLQESTQETQASILGTQCYQPMKFTDLLEVDYENLTCPEAVQTDDSHHIHNSKTVISIVSGIAATVLAVVVIAAFVKFHRKKIKNHYSCEFTTTKWDDDEIIICE